MGTMASASASLSFKTKSKLENIKTSEKVIMLNKDVTETFNTKMESLKGQVLYGRASNSEELLDVMGEIDSVSEEDTKSVHTVKEDGLELKGYLLYDGRVYCGEDEDEKTVKVYQEEPTERHQSLLSEYLDIYYETENIETDSITKKALLKELENLEDSDEITLTISSNGSN